MYHYMHIRTYVKNVYMYTYVYVHNILMHICTMHTQSYFSYMVSSDATLHLLMSKIVGLSSDLITGAAEHIFHKGGPTYMQSCNYVAIAYKITQFSV